LIRHITAFFFFVFFFPLSMTVRPVSLPWGTCVYLFPPLARLAAACLFFVSRTGNILTRHVITFKENYRNVWCQDKGVNFSLDGTLLESRPRHEVIWGLSWISFSFEETFWGVPQ
jgi:hypothetical protein